MSYDILPGRNSENAKKAIALAEERGFPAESVLTFRDGYKVPLADEDAPKADSEDEDAPKPKTPRKRTSTKKE